MKRFHWNPKLVFNNNIQLPGQTTGASQSLLGLTSTWTCVILTSLNTQANIKDGVIFSVLEFVLIGFLAQRSISFHTDQSLGKTEGWRTPFSSPWTTSRWLLEWSRISQNLSGPDHGSQLQAVPPRDLFLTLGPSHRAGQVPYFCFFFLLRGRWLFFSLFLRGRCLFFSFLGGQVPFSLFFLRGRCLLLKLCWSKNLPRVQIKMWAVVRIQRCFKAFLKRKAQQRESKKKVSSLMKSWDGDGVFYQRADTKERWKKHIEGDDYVPSPPSASSINRSGGTLLTM